MNWDFPKSYHSRPVRRLLETVDSCQRALERRRRRCRHRRLGVYGRANGGRIWCFGCASCLASWLGMTTREAMEQQLEGLPESTVIWRDEEY